MSILSMIVIIGLLLGAEPVTDLEKCQGTWTIEYLERRGKKEPEEKLTKRRIVIKEAMFLVEENGKELERATVKLDPAGKPKTFDLQPADSKEEVCRGIYELQGDTLKLCYRKAGGERPTDFATKRDDRYSMLMILKRETK